MFTIDRPLFLGTIPEILFRSLSDSDPQIGPDPPIVDRLREQERNKLIFPDKGPPKVLNFIIILVMVVLV